LAAGAAAAAEDVLAASRVSAMFYLVEYESLTAAPAARSDPCTSACSHRAVPWTSREWHSCRSLPSAPY